MQQTVMVFDDATARTTALGANVSEGMLSYLKDTNQVEVYNGSSWVASDDPNAIQNTIVDAQGDLITATAADTPARLAVGTTGQVLTVDSTTATGLKWATPSSGGITWTPRNANNLGTIVTIAYNGSNLYIAAGISGVLYSSPDGITWTSRTSGFGSNDINRVIYANSLWVAVGSGGLISTSTDGITWTARTANFGTNAINDVHYASGNFVAVGAGGGATNTGGLTYSTDGLTWARKSQTFSNVGNNYYSVTHNGTQWLIGAQGGTSTNSIVATTPSGTWTELGIGSTTGSIYYTHYDGTRTWIVDQGQTGYYYSTSSTYASWTFIVNANLTPPRLNSVFIKAMISIYNGKIYQTNGYYIQIVSATPVNTDCILKESASLSPAITINTSSPFFGSSTNAAILATANGIILGGAVGQIWTSF